MVISGQNGSQLHGPTTSHAAEAGVFRSSGRWKTTLIHLVMAFWPEIAGPAPTAHMEAFRGKSGLADLEVTISCLDPGPFASRSLPALHSLPALKLLGPAVNLGTIKPSKGLVLRTISWRFCNKGASCPGRCETSRQADGTLLKGHFQGGEEGGGV